MEEKISVQLTKETLFDFLLYHTYSKGSGFLTNVLGMAVGIMGVILRCTGNIGYLHLVVYLVAAVAFICYTPLQLKIRAKKQMEVNPEYKEPCEYIFSDTGIMVIRAGKKDAYEWKDIKKTVVTPKNIGIYKGKDEAFILPKDAFGDRFVPVLQMIVKYIGQQNVRLR